MPVWIDVSGVRVDIAEKPEVNEAGVPNPSPEHRGARLIEAFRQRGIEASGPFKDPKPKLRMDQLPREHKVGTKRRWHSDENEFLLRMRKQGRDWDIIAQRLGRTPAACEKHYRKLMAIRNRARS
jgi:hypothetical protein